MIIFYYKKIIFIIFKKINTDKMSSCDHCNATLKSKYSLKTHLVTNKACLKIRGVDMPNKWQCSACSIILSFKSQLVAHQDICKDFIKKEYDEKIIKLQQEYNEKENKLLEKVKELEGKYNDQKKSCEEKVDLEVIKIKTLELKNTEMFQTVKQQELKIIDMKYNYEKIIKDIQSQNDKLLENLQKLASQAIDRPTTMTNNVTTIKNHFSDKYFLEAIKAEDVKMKCQNYLTEQVFLEGQRGIAQLCTEHVIKTKDNKALMLCTDVSRKKFKYMDDQGNIKEDYDARTFTNKVSKPIKDASRIVYDSILFDVKSEKEMLEEDDYSRKAYLNSKELKTIDCFVQITHFDDPDNNGDFKNELAILNKNL